MLPGFAARDRQRPVMDYIRHMENLVRDLRANQRRWNWLVFGMGFGTGGGMGFLLRHLLR